MSDEQSSFRQLVKTTSVFGGVQVYSILLGVLRNKALAILLGPAGIGLSGLLTSTTAMVASVTDLGLMTSAVRDVAAAHASEDSEQMAVTITVFRRLVWISGLIGMGVTIVLAPWLSRFAFGDQRRTSYFILISVTLLFGQLAASRNVVLQGTRRLADLAKLNMLGNTFGLIASILIYVFLKQDGIVPAIVASAMASMGVAIWFGRKFMVSPARVSLRETWRVGRTMATMGIAVALNGLMLTGSAYLLRIYLSGHGSLVDVGMYSAGFGVLNTYVGMIFNAMLADYYPRLTAAIQEGDYWRTVVNHQAVFSLLVLAPFLAWFIIFTRPMILILYSERFLVIDTMLQWAALGVLFKVVAWPIGFLFVPKGHPRLFLTSEFAANSYLLGLSVFGYASRGLTGLGIGFAVGHALYLLQSLVMARWAYNFRYESTVWRLALLQLLLVSGGLAAMLLLNTWIAYLAAGGLALVTSVLSIIELDKRLNLRAMVDKVRKRITKSGTVPGST